jgi:arylsulfatase A
LYEGGIRVPFIARWPGQISPGRVSGHVSAFWDILPTISDIAGVNMKEIATEGISLLPTLLGNSKEKKEHDYLYWEFHERKYSQQAVRKGDWKAVRKDPAREVELYNLEADPSEEHNLAEDKPEIVKEIEDIMDNARTDKPYWKLKRSDE